MSPNYEILKLSWKSDFAFFVKIYILDLNTAGGGFLRFVASFVSYTIFKFIAEKTITSAVYSRNFEHFITSSLPVALVECCFFAPIQMHGASNECSNEHCRQTTNDKMLKFVEDVKLGFIFTGLCTLK